MEAPELAEGVLQKRGTPLSFVEAPATKLVAAAAACRLLAPSKPQLPFLPKEVPRTLFCAVDLLIHAHVLTAAPSGPL